MKASTDAGNEKTKTLIEGAAVRTAIERQKELEALSLSLGRERYVKRVEKARREGKASNQGAERRLLSEATGDLGDLLFSRLAECLVGLSDRSAPKRKGPKHMALPWIEKVGPDVAAYLTAKAALDGVELQLPVSKVGLRVAGLVIDELRWRRMEEEAPALLDHVLRRMDTSSYAHMARSTNAALSYSEVDTSDLEMSTPDRMKLGVFLVDRLIESTGLFEVITRKAVEKRWGKKKNQVRVEKILAATKETQEWIAKRDDILMGYCLDHLPMVMPPLAWGPKGNHRGGYRFALRNKHPLVRAASDEQREILKDQRMPEVYKALNAVQETAWRINLEVEAVLRVIEKRGGGTGPVPDLETIPMPARPKDIDHNEEARKSWRKKAGRAKDMEARRVREARSYSKVLTTARRVMHDERLFFPHNVDFRGRVYPIATYLSPQGNDLEKGLLEFAETRPLGQYGMFWLGVYGANCMGTTPGGQKVSQMTLEERVAWVVDAHDHIMAVAEDPFDAHAFWTSAEDPTRFLAFCFEYGRAQAHFEETGGDLESFESRLPVTVDGACNGLQHLTAIFQDPIGAEAVNVLPSGRPKDVYTQVSTAVLDDLERRVGEGDDLAALWLTSGLVDRKLTKRPVMTVGYGSKQYGFGQQLYEYVRGLESWHEIKETFTVPKVDRETGEITGERIIVRKACQYMADRVWDALGVTVQAAVAGMGWMQESAKAVAKSGETVGWTVPVTGFPVRQAYFKTNRKRVKTILAGSIFRPSLQIPTKEVNPAKQASAVAPNIVHSLDAGHLMITVASGVDEGISSWAMVHDSYGTHAGDMELLGRILRQAFVRLYSEDVATVLFGSFLRAADDPEDVEDPRAYQGEVDLGSVHASPYFFA